MTAFDNFTIQLASTYSPRIIVPFTIADVSTLAAYPGSPQASPYSKTVWYPIVNPLEWEPTEAFVGFWEGTTFTGQTKVNEVGSVELQIRQLEQRRGNNDQWRDIFGAKRLTEATQDGFVDLPVSSGALLYGNPIFLQVKFSSPATGSSDIPWWDRMEYLFGTIHFLSAADRPGEALAPQ